MLQAAAQDVNKEEAEQKLKELDELCEDMERSLAKLEVSTARMVFMSQMMRNLMWDLLDLAQLDRGSFNVNNEYFNLVQLLGKAFDMLEYHAEQKQITFESKLLTESKFFTSVFGDERRYMQILVNFLSNSLKFSPRGSTITISLEVKEQHLKPESVNSPLSARSHKSKKSVSRRPSKF